MNMRQESERLLHSGFQDSLQAHPDALALTVGKSEWTYAEVDATARRWASALLEGAGGAPKRVGVFAYRSEASYAGVLASLFAGAAYVPLNRTFPVQRTRMMMEQAELDAVIVDRASLPQFCEIVKELEKVPGCVLLPDSEAGELTEFAGRVFDRTELERAELERVSGAAASPAVSSDSIAYLLFTSGSTGIPKGVPVTHANAVHFLKVNQQRYRITPEDRLTQTFDQTFDLSVFDLFMAWNNGAAVCSMQPIQLLSPFRFLQEKGITVWFSVPSVAALLRKQNILKPGSLPGLRLSLFCGEALPRAAAEAWQEAAPNAVLENLYGPTELTIACAAYRWDPASSPQECLNETVPIGQPYPGLDAILLDEELQPVPHGAEGELCVAGPQTFPGYWRDPAQTKQRLIQLETESGEVKTYYRTGDRVRWLPSGNLAYLGRMDHQVKVQGYRVELSEIEGVLSRQPGVVSAVALGWPLENGSVKGITAFVIGPDADAAGLLAAAKDQLPSYMVPRTVHQVEAMPLNANGKIDRNELLRRLAEQEKQGVAR